MDILQKIQDAKKMILKYLIDSLYAIHNGDFEARIYATAKLAVVGSPLGWVAEYTGNWFALNSGYVIFVFIAIIIDHIIGTYIHAMIKKDFSVKRNVTGFLGKSLLVVAVGVLVEGMALILGADLFVTEYFSVVARLMVFVYPAGSALMNISILTKGKFPPTAFMDRIRRFNTSLDLKDIQDKNTPENED